MSAAERLKSFLEGHLERRAPLEKAAHEAGWQLALTGDSKWEAESARLETELKKLFADRSAYSELEAIRGTGEITDPDLSRQLELLLLAFKKNQVSEELLEELVALQVKAEALYAKFRPELDGEQVTENHIRQILRSSDDVQERIRAWEASKEIGRQVAPLILEMVDRRNRSARDLGYRDYFAMDLDLQEIDETYLFDVLDRLENLTKHSFGELIDDLFVRLAARFGCSKSEIRPWHLSDPFFQEAVPPADLGLGEHYREADLVELTRSFYERIGFDIGPILERSDLFPRDRKNQHAFCSHIDRSSDDIRVLCNNVRDEYWMDTMLHEFGHAVYDQGLGTDLPWILRAPAHTLTTEAIALLFGRLATNPDWIVRYVGADPEAVTPIRDGLRELTRMKQLLFPRWVMVMTHFERALYADPGQDLNALWWDLVERFQKVPRPEGRDAPDWAAKLHIALAPVYYQNYLLGDLMASQLHGTLERELGTAAYFDRPETGRLLRERLFRHGARRPWNEALLEATGERLEPRHYADQFFTVAS